MYIDTHAHLNFKAFDKDLKEIITLAEKVGVKKIIIPGAKIDSGKKAIEIANIFPNCYATIGIHPHHIHSIKLNEIKKELIALIGDKGVIGLGEIGLDYHHYKGYPSVSKEDKKLQKEVFINQLEIALAKNLPVIIHCREAFDDLIEIISTLEIAGVFHCFTGEKLHLKKILEFGFYVGFDGNITYPENDFLRDLVKFTPIERILLETDSPYLAPLPFRDKRNNPSNLVIIAKMIAKLKSLTIEEIEKNTYHNAIKLFHL